MSKKCYIPYKVKAKFLKRDNCNWVVYKWEYGKVQPTFYKNKKEAERNKDYICI